MGGPGSGNWYNHPAAKRRVEDTYTLPVGYFRKQLADGRPWAGSIGWTQGGREVGRIGVVIEAATSVRLVYTVAKGKPDERKYNYRVNVTATTPHYGGRRHWWECPGCGRRCAILYGLWVYLCRQCQGLTYRSCQESRKWDNLYADLARRAGCSPSEARDFVRSLRPS